MILDPRLLDMPKECVFHARDVRYALSFFERRKQAGFQLTIVVQHAPWPDGSRLVGLVKKVDDTPEEKVLDVFAVLAVPDWPPKYVVSLRHNKEPSTLDCVVVLGSPPNKDWLREVRSRATEMDYVLEVTMTQPCRKSVEEALDTIEALIRDAIKSEED